MSGGPTKRLSDAEFEDVVEELSREQEGVDVEDARAALKELDLPAERLEEAAETVRRNRAQAAFAATERKRRLVTLGGALAVVTSAIVAGALYWQHQTAAHARITTSATQLTEEAGQLKLSTRLMDAPKGESVPMTCTWRTPEGAILHQNAWETKPVNHEAWETHCVLKQAPEHVKVEMRAHDRVVAESSK